MNERDCKAKATEERTPRVGEKRVVRGTLGDDPMSGHRCWQVEEYCENGWWKIVSKHMNEGVARGAM